MSRAICIRNGVIVTMNPQREIIEGGTVIVEDDRIAGVHRDKNWKGRGDDETIDASGKVVIPGLINSHMHSRPFRALGDDLTGAMWAKRYAVGLSKVMDEEGEYLGGLNAFAECLKGGVTCACNMPPFVEGCDRAAWEIGIRAILFPHGGDDPTLTEANESLEKSVENVARAGDQKQKRVKIWFGFGHPKECSPEYFKKLRTCATQYGVGIQGHVAMNQREAQADVEKWGRPVIEYFSETGFLGPDVVIDHGVWLTPQEIRLLAKNGTPLIHSPRMNMRYGNGVTPVPEMLKEGVCVALGTDGPLSTYRIDMFEAMRLACFLQRVHKRDVSALSAMQALEMVTLGGAKAVGLEREIGSLEAGKKADIALIDFRQPHLTPYVTGRHGNLITLLVFSCSAADVDTVLVNGKIVVRDRKLLTVNEGEMIARVNEYANRALAQID